MKEPNFKVLFQDLDPGIVEALKRAFSKHKKVFVAQGDAILSSADAIVTAANSFGDMGAGFDLAVDSYFGGEANVKLRQAISTEWYGELPVGAAILLDMNDDRFRYLVAAPTMRVPDVVRGSIAAYLAMRGAFVAIQRHLEKNPNSIESVICPGLGTGIGGMDPDDAALQMEAAYRQVVLGEWTGVGGVRMPPFPRRR